MRRVRLMAAALLGGALLGGLCTYRPSAGGAKETLPKATQEICRAIVDRRESGWATVRQRYCAANRSSGSAPEADMAVREARAQSAFFHPEDPIGQARESASGKAGDRAMAAIECPIGAGRRARAVTVRWVQDHGRRWVVDGVTSTPLSAGGVGRMHHGDTETRKDEREAGKVIHR